DVVSAPTTAKPVREAPSPPTPGTDRRAKGRLLFIMNEALFFTTHRMPLAQAAADLGYEVHVAAPYEQPWVDRIVEAGFRYHSIPLRRGGRSVVGELRLFLALLSLIRTLRPDLVHHVAMKSVVFGGAASRLLRVPAAVHAVT